MKAALANIGKPSVLSADTPLGLSAIHKSDCAAAIWQREPLPSFQAWIDSLAPAELPKTRVTLQPSHVRDATSHVCELCGTPDCQERARLIDDVAALSDIFARLMGAPYVQLRLDVVTTSYCRKFHVDAVTARLICTYRGTGTQYTIGADGTNPQHVLTAPTGSPILMRGTLWPEIPQSRVLHRSPPIEGSGETRLVLILDPITDADDLSLQKIIH